MLGRVYYNNKYPLIGEKFLGKIKVVYIPSDNLPVFAKLGTAQFSISITHHFGHLSDNHWLSPKAPK